MDIQEEKGTWWTSGPYKSRLVIKDYKQKEGKNYFDIYSSVSRITSIRIILVIASLQNPEIH